MHGGNISNMKIGGSIRLTLIPAIYYLYLDSYHGSYFTATGKLSHTKFPFTIESTINKTFTSNLPGNKDFLWNIVFNYNFRKNLITKI